MLKEVANIESEYNEFTNNDDEQEWRWENDEFDDNTGEVLPAELVTKAKEDELKFFSSKNVWDIVPLPEAKCISGKAPIGVRWVIVNKGDKTNPNIRARLVAKEINT